ncbi:MAG: DUF1127 domain-containing protein [Ramlibacter sp.]
MTFTLPFSAIANSWQRLVFRFQEARRMRRDLQELSAMDAHELRDLGISHVALAVNARWVTRCE